jgi:hypothetical protein
MWKGEVVIGVIPWLLVGDVVTAVDRCIVV